jgi:hypothetical protein
MGRGSAVPDIDGYGGQTDLCYVSDFSQVKGLLSCPGHSLLGYAIHNIWRDRECDGMECHGRDTNKLNKKKTTKRKQQKTTSGALQIAASKSSYSCTQSWRPGGESAKVRQIKGSRCLFPWTIQPSPTQPPHGSSHRFHGSMKGIVWGMHYYRIIHSRYRVFLWGTAREKSKWVDKRMTYSVHGSRNCSKIVAKL